MNFLKITYSFIIFLLTAFATTVASEALLSTVHVPHHTFIVADNIFKDLQSPTHQEVAMTKTLAGFVSRSDIPHELKDLLENCTVRPGGILQTSKTTVYFCKHKSSKRSHWVIKQLKYDLQGENQDLNAILKLLHNKEANSCNRLSFAMPECTFTITPDSDNATTHFTLYHRVNGTTIYDNLPAEQLSGKAAMETVQNLGSQLFKLHERRPTTKELESLASKTDEINICRYYGDSNDQDFEQHAPRLLKITDPLLRLFLTRCMGDLHTRNTLQKMIGSLKTIVLIDYTTLARDTAARNKCSSFVNDVSYFIFCAVNFYGYGRVPPEFLSNFLASYLRTVHPDYHQPMLAETKVGFNFFVNQLTHDFSGELKEFSSTSAIPNRIRRIIEITAQLRVLMLDNHDLSELSDNDEILQSIKAFQNAQQKLKTSFIDSVLEGATQILAATPWEEIQKTTLAKVMKRRRHEKPSQYIFTTETMQNLLARLARLSPEQAIQVTDETKQKLPIGLACMFAGTTINSAIQTLGTSFTAERERRNYRPRTTASIYGPYQLEFPYIQSLKMARERFKSAQATARITRSTQVTTLVLPEVIQCSDGAYLTYQGLGEVQSAADLLMLSQQPDPSFPEYYHAAKIAENLSSFRTFGAQVFNLHLAARKAHLAPEEITKALGRPSHPTIASYLLVPSVAPGIGNVFFSRNKQRTFIDCQTTQVLSSRERFTKDVYGFIQSAFESSKTETTVALVAAFLDGYLSAIPESIVREHMLPDLRLAFLRGGNNLFESIIAKTKFASFVGTESIGNPLKFD